LSPPIGRSGMTRSPRGSSGRLLRIALRFRSSGVLVTRRVTLERGTGTPGVEVGAEMALQDHEERALAQIERQLADDDPRFVARLARTRSWLRIPRRVLFASALVLTYALGLLIIIAGVTLPSVILVVLGSLVTAAFPVAAGRRAWRERPRSPFDGM
jgi:hypothetical protein